MTHLLSHSPETLTKSDRNVFSIEARARRRVRRKIGFAIHAFVFVMVNIGLYLINCMTGEKQWHLFPLSGWALVLGIHGMVTLFALQGDGLRERMLRQEINHLRRHSA